MPKVTAHRPWRALLLLAAAAVGVSAAAPPRAHADTRHRRRASTHTTTAATTTGKAPARAKAKTKAKARNNHVKPASARSETRLASAKRGPAARAPAKVVAAPEPAPPPLKGQVAVFTFAGGGAGAAVRAQVVDALRAKGLVVTTTLRPVDTPEQYRDMAATLGLAAYIDGVVRGDGESGRATVSVRSGVTGRRIASATFSGRGEALSADVGRELWGRVGGNLARMCAEASKPRRRTHAPMRIDAGTPIETKPPAEEAEPG